MNLGMNVIMKKTRFLILTLIVCNFGINQSQAATIDLQANLNRIIAGINRFDANSSNSVNASSMSDVKQLFQNNANILKEIEVANSAFRKDLNRAKRYIPSRDTKESPAFQTLMNLSRGYEEWLRYQRLNQLRAKKCIEKSGSSFSSFSSCSIAALNETLENERLGRVKLQAALDAWQKWRVKYGYA